VAVIACADRAIHVREYLTVCASGLSVLSLLGSRPPTRIVQRSQLAGDAAQTNYPEYQGNIESLAIGPMDI
jgi:hypothetical protein